jgi:predicted NACHT family NTPase
MLVGTEFLVAWGVSNAFGFVFKPIFENLVQEPLEDYIKDFFKSCIKDFVDLAKEKDLKIAYGRANKVFLELLQEELEEAGIETLRIYIEYEDSVKKFIRHPTVLETLGIPLQKELGYSIDENQSLDTRLMYDWNNLNLKDLPTEFQWQQVARKYSRKVISIVKESDELRKILDAENILQMRMLLEQNAPIAPDFDLSRYQKGLQTAYKRLKLDSLDTSGCNYSLQLWDIFVAQDVREETGSQQTQCSILEILNDQTYKYTVILGHPGSGKSTLVQYKALEWVRTQLRDVLTKELPLLIELRNYIENKDKNFLEYFHKGTGVLGGLLNQNELEKWLKNNQTIVLFDGLDEVLDPSKRENVVIDITNFTATYPKARVIVTSRIIGYEQQQHRFRDANFREFMLQDLNAVQISNFVRKWHELAFEDKFEGEKKRERLQNSIDNSPAFRELAGNPLLLTMMTILNRNQELPRDKATLYENASEVLLQRWDGDKNLPEDKRLDPDVSNYLDYRTKQEMLRLVAHRIQESVSSLDNKSLVISQVSLEETLANYLQDIVPQKAKLVARVLREQLTSRSFILCFLGGDSYGFVHRTFLEYFCASYFVEQYEKKRNIDLEYLKHELFGKRYHDTSWHEALTLITAKIDEKFAKEIIDYLIAQDEYACNSLNLFLANQCLSNVRNRHQLQSTADKLLERLRKLATSQGAVTDAIRHQAVEAIATLEAAN